MPPIVEYGGTLDAETGETWQSSVFYHLLKEGRSEFRCRFEQGERADFNWLEHLAAEGHTDYLAFVHRFADKGVISEMNAVYSHWSTRNPGGFSAGDCEALRRLVPTLALALKCVSVSRAAGGTLAEVYLGRDASRRVLSSRFSRGTTEQIRAVLWFSNLKGYTAISDRTEPTEIIPLLNDHVAAVIFAVHRQGGDVMKLIGDGILAIFQADDVGACRAALRAASDLEKRVEALNASRAAEGRPVTSFRVGLHIGDVFYGDIGSDERLDFTVVGPTVNEVTRIAAMGVSVDRDFLVSESFLAAMPVKMRAKFVSVGRFALRGVRLAQELFTLDPSFSEQAKAPLA